MKKFIVLSFVMSVILAFGSMVYGQEKAPVLEFKASGFIDAQSLWWENVSAGNPAAGIYNPVGSDFKTYSASQGRPAGVVNKPTAYFESRARLKFDAIMGKDLSGTFFFEMDSTWGDTPGAVAMPKLSERNTFGYWSGDRAALEIKNVYIDWGVPYFGIPAPMTFRIGLQPFSIRNNLFLYTDGMGVSFAIKPDPVLINFLYAKPQEGNISVADDVDVYGLQANVRVGTLTIGGYAMWYNMNAYPFFVATTSYPGATTPSIPLAQIVNGTNKANIGWYGAYVDGKVGPVNLNADFILDYGKVQAGASRGLPGSGDVRYSGWVTRLNLNYVWEKFTFGASTTYATGANPSKTSSNGLPGSAAFDGTPTSKVKSFVVPPGSETGAIYGESVVFYSSWINRGDSGLATSLNYQALSRGGTGGTWNIRPYVGFQVLPELKFTLQGLYIGDTTRMGNTFGTARSGDGSLRNDPTIGWEADIIAEVMLHKNLKLSSGFGWLWAGKALDYWTGIGTDNFSPNNPWQWTTNLTYSF